MPLNKSCICTSIVALQFYTIEECIGLLRNSSLCNNLSFDKIFDKGSNTQNFPQTKNLYEPILSDK